MKFDFSKSSEPDFRNKFQSDLNILMKNMLYCTHQIDKCLLVLRKLETDAGTQKQVDDYFNDKDSEQEEDKEPD